MADRNYVASIATAIEHESAMAAQTIDQLAADPERFSELLHGDLDPAFVANLNDPGFIATNKETIADFTARYLELAELPQPAAIANLEAELQQMPADSAALARLLRPAYGTSIRRAHSSLAELDAIYVDVLTATYQSQHGRPPQSIEDLESIVREARQLQDTTPAPPN